jgi:hypothetical protein
MNVEVLWQNMRKRNMSCTFHAPLSSEVPVERFGGGRPLLSVAVLHVLNSSMFCPPGIVFVRCKLRVLLHALLHVAITVVFRAMHFHRITPAVHSPLSITGMQRQNCIVLTDAYDGQSFHRC